VVGARSGKPRQKPFPSVTEIRRVLADVASLSGRKGLSVEYLGAQFDLNVLLLLPMYILTIWLIMCCISRAVTVQDICRTAESCAGELSDIVPVTAPITQQADTCDPSPYRATMPCRTRLSSQTCGDIIRSFVKPFSSASGVLLLSRCRLGWFLVFPLLFIAASTIQPASVITTLIIISSSTSMHRETA
jgi:hypothetical protein